MEIELWKIFQNENFIKKYLNFYVVFLIYLVLYGLQSSIGNDYDDFRKKIAKKYDVGMDFVPTNLMVEYNSLLIPHNTLYVTTNSGSDITLATDYFGITFYDEDNIEKYLGLSD